MTQIPFMKIYLSVLIVTALLNSECRKTTMDIPVCVQQRIEAIMAEPKWNPPAQVDEWIYKNEPVFLFSSDCCDQLLMLYDGSCSFICSPGGGIAGGGDGKCADFYESATHVRLVWKDNR